jgi:hypothetical protein
MKRPTRLLVVIFALLAVVLSASCGSHRQPASNTIVLSYDELGPQAAVFELIGFQWYQWNGHGSDDPTTIDDIKVVVYRNISFAKVKEMYLVIEGKQDYRYLDYTIAMAYLTQYENEPILKHLQTTKKKIIAQLGP